MYPAEPHLVISDDEQKATRELKLCSFARHQHFFCANMSSVGTNADHHPQGVQWQSVL